MTLYQRCLFPTPSSSIFPMQQNPSEQDLGCLLVCSSFCLRVGRFSTGLNQEHIQSTCNFLTRKTIASLGYFRPLLQVFSLLLPFSIPKEIQENVILPQCPCAPRACGCQFNPGEDGLIWTDWQAPVSGCEPQQYSQAGHYYFSFVAYWLTVKSEILVFKTRQLWWSFLKKFIKVTI